MAIESPVRADRLSADHRGPLRRAQSRRPNAVRRSAPTITTVRDDGRAVLASARERDGALAGKMLFGDFCLGYVHTLAIADAGAAIADTHVGHLAFASGWAQGPDGFVYATTFGSCETGGLDPADPPPSGLWRAIPSP